MACNTAGTKGDNGDWLAESEPVETAVLYDSYKSSVACGHFVSLRRMIRRLQDGEPTCPICQKFVGYVSDASKKEAVVFKFGKTVYRLSVAEPPRHRPWWGFVGSTKTNITAQERIADVLGISRGMKV